MEEKAAIRSLLALAHGVRLRAFRALIAAGPEGMTPGALTQALEVQSRHRVLEIGTGSGYMAALLAAQAKEVVTLEIDPELAEMARENLLSAGVKNVEVKLANGATASLAQGAFDVIVLSGSLAQVPQSLLRQLNVGGRLAAIVGEVAAERDRTAAPRPHLRFPHPARDLPHPAHT